MDAIEQRLLKWCRSTPRGFGIPCMRSGGPPVRQDGKPNPPYRIVDNNRWDSPLIASGNNWQEVAEALAKVPAAGFEL